MDPIMKAMYLGLGALSMTSEKAGGIIADLVKRGEMSENEGAELVDHLLKGAERQQKEIEGKVAATVQKVMSDNGLPTRQDFQTLASRLDGIEKAMGTARKAKRGKKA